MSVILFNFPGTIGNEVNGQVDKDQASLYMLDNDNFIDPEVEVRPVSVSNGIAWTADSKYMFYIDTPTRNIDVFDFDLEKGTIRKFANTFYGRRGLGVRACFDIPSRRFRVRFSAGTS